MVEDPETMSVLQDILRLPREIRNADFVVRIAEGVANPDSLLDRYAVTPDIHTAFKDALELTQEAVLAKASRGAYVHGSFGAGKSQFMGVLSLLLGGNESAWKLPELHDLWEKFAPIRTKKLLRLHFHMTGAKSLEEKVFTQYLEVVRKQHPGAPVPPLFRDGPLFQNAREYRKQLGDSAFFGALNAGQDGAEGWGEMGGAGTWDAPRFDAACDSDDLEARAQLFADLVKLPVFAGYVGGGEWVSFEDGLKRISRHAAGLGYEGLVFFLDELILWLAANASDTGWLNGEGQKVAKLVDSEDPDRPIPFVAFIARQRDLADLVGERMAGADAQNLRDSLKWEAGRFRTIKLEDRNLPVIIEKKILEPKDDAARAKLQRGFEDAKRALGVAFGDLLGEIGAADDSAFRRVYPFSPALIETLVALSNALQKDRTALKVMVELLVRHLEDFQLGQVVPVGDLFDVLAGGDEPMDLTMRAQFNAARRLYQGELLDRIRERNATNTPEKCQRLRDDHQARLGCSNCPQTACRGDNRLIKTLLLAQLAPLTKSLKDLTAKRLYALNFGAVVSIIKGREAADAVERLRGYASQVGKLRLGDGANPSVSVVLEGIDIGPILQQASGFDSEGARRAKVKQLLFADMGLEIGSGPTRHEVEWHGIRRRGSVVFGNIREMDLDLLACPPDEDFRVVLDYPFDQEGRGPGDDLRRLHEFQDARTNGTCTVAWLPDFFSEKLQRELGQLVILDRLSEGAFRDFSLQFSEENRARAKQEIDGLAGQKKLFVKRALLAVYELGSMDEAFVDPARRAERHFVTLQLGAEVRVPGAADFKNGLNGAIFQLLEARFPHHPAFEGRVTAGRLEKALGLLREVCEAQGQRKMFDRSAANDIEVARDLSMITLADGVATLRAQTFDDVDRALRADGQDSPTVARVRRQWDPKGVRGLTPEVLDFLTLAFAEAQHRLLVGSDGRPVVEPRIGHVPDDAVLTVVDRPTEQAWQAALTKAGGLFGIAIGSRANTPRNLAQLAKELGDKADAARRARAGEIAGLLGAWRDFVPATAPRSVTATSAAELLEVFAGAGAKATVEALAAFEPRTSVAALAAHLRSAGEVARVLEDDLVRGSLERMRGRSEPQAQTIVADVQRALSADALQEPQLEATLRGHARRAQDILNPVGSGGDRPVPGSIVAEGKAQSLAALDAEKAKIQQALEKAGQGARLEITWKVTRS